MSFNILQRYNSSLKNNCEKEMEGVTSVFQKLKKKLIWCTYLDANQIWQNTFTTDIMYGQAVALLSPIIQGTWLGLAIQPPPSGSQVRKY